MTLYNYQGLDVKALIKEVKEELNQFVKDKLPNETKSDLKRKILQHILDALDDPFSLEEIGGILPNFLVENLPKLTRYLTYKLESISASPVLKPDLILIQNKCPLWRNKFGSFVI